MGNFRAGDRGSFRSLDPLIRGGATALTPLRPTGAVYQRGEYQDPPDVPSQDARLRRNYGYPFVPYE